MMFLYLNPIIIITSDIIVCVNIVVFFCFMICFSDVLLYRKAIYMVTRTENLSLFKSVHKFMALHNMKLPLLYSKLD